jgi:hypothetical protein
LCGSLSKNGYYYLWQKEKAFIGFDVRQASRFCLCPQPFGAYAKASCHSAETNEFWVAVHEPPL